MTLNLRTNYKFLVIQHNGVKTSRKYLGLGIYNEFWILLSRKYAFYWSDDVPNRLLSYFEYLCKFVFNAC